MSENEGEFLSYLGITPHLKVLRGCGILPVDPSNSKLKKRLHVFYMWIGFLLLILYTLLQIINVYQISADINKVIDSLFLLLTFFACIGKQLMFLLKPHKILEMFDIMKGSSFNQGLDAHRPLLVKTNYYARLLLRIFNRLCVAFCFLWSLMPTILHFKHKPVELTIWVPFDAKKRPHFLIATGYTWLQNTWCGFNISTMNLFIVYLFTQTKTQISILRINLESLVSVCQEEARISSITFTEVLEYRFRGIIRHFNDIVKFSNLIEDIFNAALLFQFLFSGGIICTTTYRTTNMNPASGEFLSMMMYMTCILSELYLFCFSGNEVAYESEKIIESAYCMEWEEMPVKYRRYLIIFMERIKSSIEPKAGKTIPLSLNTFVQIIKTSYTFYTFLVQSQQM